MKKRTKRGLRLAFWSAEAKHHGPNSATLVVRGETEGGREHEVTFALDRWGMRFLFGLVVELVRAERKANQLRADSDAALLKSAGEP